MLLFPEFHQFIIVCAGTLVILHHVQILVSIQSFALPHQTTFLKFSPLLVGVEYAQLALRNFDVSPSHFGAYPCFVVETLFVVLSASVCHASVRPVQFVSTPLAGVPRAGVTKVGEVALTSPPVPVDVAPQRVSTIAATVVSSRTVLAAAVIVAVSGTPVEAVVLPINWSCARLAILARVTALLAIVVAFPVLVTSPVRLAFVVTVAALPVIEPVIAFVTSKSVNQPLVTRVAVAPIVVTNRFAHFLSVVPRSSVLSVSETSEVLIATLARFDSAVLAHAAGISEVRAIVPVVAGAVKTTPVPATALGCIVTSPEVFP